MSGDSSDSLFSDKDSLGEGWGKPAPEEEPALAPVDWTKLPDAPDPAKRPRARLATPAPGSQKGSGLLDIRALAGAMKAEKEAEVGKPSPPPAEARGARLATAAKGSAGSGLIDVAALVRQTEAAESVSEGRLPDPSPGASSSGPAASLSGSSHSSSALASSDESLAVDDEFEAASGGRTMIYVMLGLLTLAVAGLAVYVLTQ